MRQVDIEKIKQERLNRELEGLECCPERKRSASEVKGKYKIQRGLIKERFQMYSLIEELKLKSSKIKIKNLTDPQLFLSTSVEMKKVLIHWVKDVAYCLNRKHPSS